MSRFFGSLLRNLILPWNKWPIHRHLFREGWAPRGYDPPAAERAVESGTRGTSTIRDRSCLQNLYVSRGYYQQHNESSSKDFYIAQFSRRLSDRTPSLMIRFVFRARIRRLGQSGLKRIDISTDSILLVCVNPVDLMGSLSII